MPESNIIHTVDVVFKSEEILELLKERSSHLSSVNKMVFDTITVNRVYEHGNLTDADLTEVPGFTVHYKAEGS
jgi:hypothetical protein